MHKYLLINVFFSHYQMEILCLMFCQGFFLSLQVLCVLIKFLCVQIGVSICVSHVFLWLFFFCLFVNFVLF